MKIKQFVASLLSVLMLLSILGGCGSAANKTAGTTSSTTAATVTTNGSTAATAPREITIFADSIKPEALIDKDPTALQMIEKMANVKVKYIANPQDKQQWVNLQIASGNTPDYFTDVGIGDYMKYVKQDVIAEIPMQMLQENNPGYLAWINKNAGDKIWNYVAVDGKNYAMPILWTIGSHSQTTGVRQDWLNEAGITNLPATLDDWEADMLKVKALKNIAPLTSEGLNGLRFVFGAFGVYPGAYYLKDGKLVNGDIEPKAKDALAVLNKWYGEGLIDKEFIINKGENVSNKWMDEKAGFVCTWNNDFIPAEAFYGGSLYKVTEKNPKAIVTAILPPKGPNGDFGTTQSNPSAGSLVFGKQMEKDPELMKAYLRFFDLSFNEDAQTIINWGVEGTTFQRVDSPDKLIDWIPPYDKEDERGEFGTGGIIVTPSCFNDYDLGSKFQTPPKYRELLSNVRALSVGQIDVMAGTVRPVAEEKKETLDKLLTKAYIDFITGKRPISEFDAFVQEWNDAGGSEVMKEAQTTYDSINGK